MRALLINSTFLAILAALLAAAASPSVSWDRLRGMLARRQVAALLLAGAALNLAFVGVAGYINPRDYVQDVIAARQFLAHDTLYPPDVPQRGIAELAGPMPGRAVLERLPLMGSQFGYLGDPPAPANAHPPLTGILLAYPVALLGLRGSFVFLFVLYTAAASAALWLVIRELSGPRPGFEIWSWLGLFLGWHGVTISLRAVQPGLLILVLLVLSWHWLRRGRPWLAGAAVALATWLHAFPALLGIYFLLRHRRALLGMAIAGAGVGVWVVLLTGPATFLEWADTVDGLSRQFLPQPGNLSLAGMLASLIEGLDLGWNLQTIASGALVLMTGVLGWLLRPWNRPAPMGPAVDVEYAICVTALLLASPLSWSRYLPLLTLPLAVLLHRLPPDAGRGERLGVLSLGAALTFPEAAWGLLGERLSAVAGFVPAWLTVSIPTLALVALMAWLARLPRKA